MKPIRNYNIEKLHNLVITYIYRLLKDHVAYMHKKHVTTLSITEKRKKLLVVHMYFIV